MEEPEEDQLDHGLESEITQPQDVTEDDGWEKQNCTTVERERTLQDLEEEIADLHLLHLNSRSKYIGFPMIALLSDPCLLPSEARNGIGFREVLLLVQTLALVAKTSEKKTEVKLQQLEASCADQEKELAKVMEDCDLWPSSAKIRSSALRSIRKLQRTLRKR
ncbi:Transmembrane And Coiled-Coil Domain-Containing Protein 5A [Manis pentadactyla]|nr:Transmembrane And Coiled-Coil Domain-Containing Protein 5A [Manis pentadactyla]